MDLFIARQLDKTLKKLRKLKLSDTTISSYLARQAKRYANPTRNPTEEEINEYLRGRGLPAAP